MTSPGSPDSATLVSVDWMQNFFVEVFALNGALDGRQLDSSQPMGKEQQIHIACCGVWNG